MKILILGSTGLLGQALMKSFKFKKDVTVIGLARKDATINCDISDDVSLKNFLNTTNPDVIINTAAIVDANFCEQRPELAYLVNTKPVSLLVNWAEKNSAYFVQISTDHYFTEDYNKVHDEAAPIKIVNEYAKTKYLGEALALLSRNSLVVRTNIVGFKNRDQRTFFEWVLKSLEDKSAMTLFCDYFTSSIDVRSFSEILFDVISLKPCGVLNIASSEVFSKEVFIRAVSKKFSLPLHNPHSISVSEANLVKRAESLGLDVSKVEAILGYKMPDMNQVIQNLYEEYLEKNYEIS